MVTDRQVRRLFQCLMRGMPLCVAACKAGVDEKTARKYRTEWRLPSEMEKTRSWKTRADPFTEEWGRIEEKLYESPRLQAKTIFEWLRRERPGIFSDGQLRTLQRRIKQWRAESGPAKEVFFEQVHHPGCLSQSDFTYMSELEITVGGKAFPHLLYHFVLTFSNWEDVTICYSESFESLSYGLQNALFRLGGAPQRHRTDRMSAAVHNTADANKFTAAYLALLGYFEIEPQTIGTNKANENGDVEQSHNRFKEAVNQELLLRGSRDFESVAEYEKFLLDLLERRNANRIVKTDQERALLRVLPPRRLDSPRRFTVPVTKFSTIRVLHNLYSVHSRLIGEKVEVRVFADKLEVWYAQKCVETLPRLRGEYKHCIQYRHIIEWLVRKPGAFENYRYKSDLFPTSHFRMAFDALSAKQPARANKEYVLILELAAKESEDRVNAALKRLIEQEAPISAAAVCAALKLPPAQSIEDSAVNAIDLSTYDSLLEMEVVHENKHEIGAFAGA